MEPKIRFDKPRRAFYVVVVAAFALIGVGAFFSSRQPAQPVATVIQQTPRVDVPQPVATPAPVQAAAPKASTAEAVASKSKEFDRLVAMSKPEAAYSAYLMLWKCKWVTSADECGDLTGGQKTMGYNLLQQAVAAHVPGAAVRLLDAAPDGRTIDEVWSDPAYAAWKQNALDELSAAAHRGDPAALRQTAELAGSLDRNPEKALVYWTAYMDAETPQQRERLQFLTPLYKEKVAPAKVALAETEGHNIFKGATK